MKVVYVPCREVAADRPTAMFEYVLDKAAETMRGEWYALLIVSGSPQYPGGRPGAQIAAEYLKRRLGPYGPEVLLETRAHSTRESIELVRELVRDVPVETFAVVATEAHAMRIHRQLRRHWPRTVPVEFRTVPSGVGEWLVQSFLSIGDVLALEHTPIGRLFKRWRRSAG